MSAVFSIVALVIFLLNIVLQVVSKSSLFRCGVEIGFGVTISDAIARGSLVFWNSVFADGIVIAASRLRRTVATFVKIFFGQLDFINHLGVAA